MNYKRVLILCIVALIIVSTISVVSAGWFDFLGGDEPEKSNTTIKCVSNKAGDGLIIHLVTPSPGDLQTNSSSRIVYVNVTDENNNTDQYNISDWEPDPPSSPYGKSSLKYILKLEPGKYTVSIYYPGDDTFKNSSFKDTFDLGPEDSENDTASDSSTEVVSTETTHDGNLTTVTTTYADGHKESHTTGTVKAYGDSNGIHISS